MLEMMMGSGKKPVPEGNVKKLVGGGSAIVALTKTGNVYSVGDSYFSGTGSATTEWNLLISGAKDIWAGFRCLLVHMEDGRWMYQGQNNHFPTELGSLLNTLTDVSAYMLWDEGEVLSSVAFGYRNLFVVFESGKYASTGANTSGGLGDGTQVGKRQLTMRSDFTNVKKIVVEPRSEDTSYMMLSTGMVYGAGSTQYGQLGVADGWPVITWKSLTTSAQAATVLDIVAAASGVFFIRSSGTGFSIYSQGWQFEGSLGTGQSAATNITTMALVASLAAKPTLYVGMFSARYRREGNETTMYTGTSSGAIQGSGASQSIRYSFAALPSNTLWGEYVALWGSYAASYLLIEGSLYVTGTSNNSTAWAFPRMPRGTYNVYTLMDTSVLL